MKKLIAASLAGLLFSGTASAQGEVLNALVGPEGVVSGLVATLTTADAAPLVDSLAGANSGLLQGTAGAGLNDVLGGLLSDQDPARIQLGLETVLMIGVAGESGVLEQLLGGLPGGAGSVPGLDGLPLLGDLAGLLGGLPDLAGGGLPGLPGGSSAFSNAQLEQVTSLLSR
ncbi:hypothetical protein PC39_12049 [Salinisphaera sp. PC39]|uniref:hypothetical protein n=1 Tax=Salinisphaera sp. PC39 TaxID=1304156 RepID=UPI0033413536